VALASCLAKVDLPPPVFPNIATFFIFSLLFLYDYNITPFIKKISAAKFPV